MSDDTPPVVGEWYATADNETPCFVVLEFDERAGSIAIQFEDGDIDEVDLEHWEQWEPGTIEMPASANSDANFQYEEQEPYSFGDEEDQSPIPADEYALEEDQNPLFDEDNDYAA